MSDTKHTPPPWEVVDIPNAGLAIRAVVPTPDGIKTLWHVPTTPHLSIEMGADHGTATLAFEEWVQFPTDEFRSQQIANAHIMGAGPELLKSCKEMVDWMEEANSIGALLDGEYDVLVKARAAIKKTEGK